MVFASFEQSTILISDQSNSLEHYARELTEFGNQIFLKVLISLATALVLFLGRKIWTFVIRSKFAKIYGSTKPSFTLIHGGLTINPRLLDSIENDKTLSRDEKDRLKEFPLVKKGFRFKFKAENVVGCSEVRATAYLAKSFAEVSGTAVLIEDDSSERIQHTLNLNFISFGAANNHKTRDLFENDGNDLVVLGETLHQFVLKGRDHPIHPSTDEKYDYGVILKCHPVEFPDKTWIACAGIGEWGTSGSAWFLANRWKVIAKKLPNASSPFAALIRVKNRKDESATLMSLDTSRNAMLARQDAAKMVPPVT